MVFSSILFLFAFLPLALGVYHGLRALVRPVAPRAWQPLRLAVLLAFSLTFYAWGEPRLIGIMLISAGTDFLAGFLIARGWRGPAAPLVAGGPRDAWQTAVLSTALAVNLGLLFFFKYYHFARESLDGLLAAAGLARTGLPELAGLSLPLGISFYTFKSMSYTIDVYRGEVTATRDPLQFACFVTLFPELVAGPIVRYSSVASQFACDQVELSGAAHGVRRFVAGLAKKVLLANTLAVPVDALFALPPAALSPAAAWLAMAAYSLQIYFDFSGYSDMAIGLGHMFGFRFPENFRHPYAATSIKDFWRRWHISLSSWFRDYVYLPLGGDRGGPARTTANLLAVFLLCGLWHGASFTFVVWGLWHGAFLLLERTRFAATLGGWPAWFRHGYVMLVAALGWVPFRAPTLAHAGGVLAALAGLAPGDPLAHPLSAYLTPPVAAALMAGALLAWPTRAGALIGLDPASVPVPPAIPEPVSTPGCAPAPSLVTAPASASAPGASLALPAASVRLLTLAALWTASLLALAAGTHNPFIYYRF